MKTVAILLCAGAGHRMGDTVADKALARLGNRPLFDHSLQAFEKHRQSDGYVGPGSKKTTGGSDVRLDQTARDPGRGWPGTVGIGLQRLASPARRNRIRFHSRLRPPVHSPRPIEGTLPDSG
ncbi:MAG: NTP transferase domain-containing protein [Opitutae bacterium]|nr:NTP transferase domain-containing protein [Opitutae bacterium]